MSTIKTKIIRNDNNNQYNYDYLFKISLIGDSGTGKTSILLRFTEDNFKDNTQSTIGVDFKIVSVSINDECKAKLQIWDTCGSERFKSLTSSFLKSCSVFILIFDLTKQKSFDNLENWIKLIYETTSPKLLCLVGNKNDLHSERIVNQKDIDNFTNKYKLNYIETSAKTAEHIEDLFIYITESLYNICKKKKGSENKDFEIGGYKIMLEKDKKEEEKDIKTTCSC
jgi:Ras-related protein Rab-11A